MTPPAQIIWFRRDLRLGDHPALTAALTAALAAGGSVLPLFIYDPETEALGAAAKWRLGQGLRVLAETLAQMGSKLVLRRGDALAVLREITAETGAAGVHWQRMYDPASQLRDSAVKAALRASGRAAHSHAGALLVEPWAVQTGTGGFYKVYSPFWRAVAGRDFGAPLPAPRALPAPAVWPASDALESWRMGAAMQRGAVVLARYAQVGEAASLARLAGFLDSKVDAYRSARDFPARDATSNLSENLAWGEVSPRQIWAASAGAVIAGAGGAEHFRKELVWREFAYHLMFHTPHILTRPWRAGWETFPWRGDNPQAEAWRRGQTGQPFVDAAMREVYVTGRMHNRARMIAASYLTKHLLTDWRVGQAWFAEVLTDWDAASNAMGWQWVAGCGPDAAPYFRIFNPEGQAEKFDESGAYRRAYIAEGQAAPPQTALDFLAAAPRAWELDKCPNYPAPLIPLAEGRARALAALAAVKRVDE